MGTAESAQLHSTVPEHFTRDMACTEAEWLRWLPAATQHRPMTISQGRTRVNVGTGHLDLSWHELPPRQIALLRIPRLAVGFDFQGVDETARSAFMRHFDLCTRRGGG